MTAGKSGQTPMDDTPRERTDRTNPPQATPGSPPAKPRPRRCTRRRLLKWGLGGAALAASGAAAHATLIEPEWIEHTRPVIDLSAARAGPPHLGPGWDGVRIAVLADLHHGPLVSDDFVRRVVKQVNAERVDFVVCVGDLVSGSVRTAELAALLRPLRAAEAKLAVLGNHDYWANAPAVTACLERAGFEVLVNAGRTFLRGGEPLSIAGVDDPWAGRPDPQAALADAPGGPRVLLCHNPDYAERLDARFGVDLMLCGHTHGGQVRLPLIGAPKSVIRHRKYESGLARGPACRVYTSRGLGVVGLPVRLGCRPELPVITLRRRANRG
jgi:hypothetical protein